MRLRLTLSFLLIVLLAISSVVFLTSRQTANELRTFANRGGFAGLNGVVTSLESFYQIHHTWEGSEKLIIMPVRAPGRGPGGIPGKGFGPSPNMRLQLLDPQGSVIFDTGSADQSSAGNPARDTTISGDELESAIPLYSDQQLVGYLRPENVIPPGRVIEVELLSRLKRSAVMATVVSGVISLLLAALLAYYLLKPVRSLTRASAALAKGDLTQRVPVQGEDEMATLAQAFNHMAASLQNAETQRRAMTADIAHELRNPLAVQRANLEALQDGIYPLTLEALFPVLEQNQLLTRLVDDLRTLALADAGELELDPTPTDFPAFLERTIHQFAPDAETRQIKLQTFIQRDCPELMLDLGRISQIMHNLLTNALQFTPEGGSISITLNCTPQRVSVEVRDSGPGIPDEALPDLFNRFYRGDRSRARAKGGTGLGLSIARRLAEAHGGKLTATNHPEGGAVFTLTLPVSQD